MYTLWRLCHVKIFNHVLVSIRLIWVIEVELYVSNKTSWFIILFNSICDNLNNNLNSWLICIYNSSPNFPWVKANKRSHGKVWRWISFFCSWFTPSISNEKTILRESLEKMFPWYYKHSDVFNSFKSLTTWCVSWREMVKQTDSDIHKDAHACYFTRCLLKHVIHLNSFGLKSAYFKTENAPSERNFSFKMWFESEHFIT